jgi:hypothetical protein
VKWPIEWICLDFGELTLLSQSCVDQLKEERNNQFNETDATKGGGGEDI